MIKCKDPTEHYSSGRELLLAYDTNKNGKLEYEEIRKAILDHTIENKINPDELGFITICHLDYNDDINAMCPSPTNYTFYLFLIAFAIVAILLIFRK